MERMQEPLDQHEDRLNGLFAAYRDSFPEAGANAEFMPNLWRKIEARRVDTASVFRRLAHVCMAATAALLLLTTFLTPPVPEDDDLYSSTYADVLAADHADAAFQEALPSDLLGEAQ